MLTPCDPSDQRCSLVAGHDGPCRVVTWREVQEMWDEESDRPLFEGKE